MFSATSIGPRKDKQEGSYLSGPWSNEPVKFIHDSDSKGRLKTETIYFKLITEDEAILSILCHWDPTNIRK